MRCLGCASQPGYHKCTGTFAAVLSPSPVSSSLRTYNCQCPGLGCGPRQSPDVAALLRQAPV